MEVDNWPNSPDMTGSLRQIGFPVRRSSVERSIWLGLRNDAMSPPCQTPTAISPDQHRHENQQCGVGSGGLAFSPECAGFPVAPHRSAFSVRRGSVERLSNRDLGDNTDQIALASTTRLPTS
jgi:hypothetical protein